MSKSKNALKAVSNKKKALITGGSQGLGKALVEQLCQQGWDVTSLDLKKPKGKLEYTFLKTDLSDRAVIDQLPEKLKDHGPFDLVIFNAGISATGKFEEMPISAYEKLMIVNAEGPMILASQFANKGLMTAKSNMAFISSLSHYTGYPGAATYAATKDTIAVYAKSITKPFADLGICVSCVFTGPLKTEHAVRHSPKDTSDENRMLPQEAVNLILPDILAGKSKVFNGYKTMAIAFAGWLMPPLVSYILLKTIYNKLDKNVY